MRYTFRAQQSTTVQLAGSPDEVRQFLQNPNYLVEALLEPDRVSALKNGLFQVTMAPIQALGTQMQPVVRLRIVADEGSNILLEAVDCVIRGNDWFDRNFDLAFAGTLIPNFRRCVGNGVKLTGEANLGVTIGLPPLLQFTPKAITNTVGNTITRGVLTAIERSLRRQLPQRFQTWQSDELSKKASQESLESSTEPMLGKAG